MSSAGLFPEHCLIEIQNPKRQLPRQIPHNRPDTGIPEDPPAPVFFKRIAGKQDHQQNVMRDKEHHEQDTV